MNNETKAPVGYLFQMTCDCGNGKTLHVSGNYAQDATAADMNAEIDKINDTFDRMRAKHEVPLIEERLEGTRLELESHQADLETFRRVHPHPKALDEQSMRKQEHKIASLKVAIARGEITLAQTKLKAQ